VVYGGIFDTHHASSSMISDLQHVPHTVTTFIEDIIHFLLLKPNVYLSLNTAQSLCMQKNGLEYHSQKENQKSTILESSHAHDLYFIRSTTKSKSRISSPKKKNCFSDTIVSNKQPTKWSS